HIFPAEWGNAPVELDGNSGSVALVTVHPEHMAPAALRIVNTVIVVGEEPSAPIREFCTATGVEIPEIPSGKLNTGEALVWFLDPPDKPLRVQTEPPRREHQRHKRKYAEGTLEEDRVFVFRGPGRQA